MGKAVKKAWRLCESSLSPRERWMFVLVVTGCIITRGWVRGKVGEQLFLYNLKVIRRLKKQKQKQLQLILRECEALQGALPTKRGLTRSFAPRLALPLLLSASISPLFVTGALILPMSLWSCWHWTPDAKTVRCYITEFRPCCYEHSGELKGKRSIGCLGKSSSSWAVLDFCLGWVVSSRWTSSFPQ